MFRCPTQEAPIVWGLLENFLVQFHRILQILAAFLAQFVILLSSVS
jgi:hypothetical protein